ncbi:hypothetical protein LUX09_13835 [Streptomyces albogriseolus]|nr:hypothetical protein [Streptomyces albogriseolus]
MTQQARRLRARLAALGAVGATALAAAGVQGAAHAADAPLPVVITGEDRVDLSLHSDNGDPTEPQVDLRLDVPGEEFEGDGEVPAVHRGEYTIRIDARGLKGVAKADLPCDADGLVAVCTGSDLYAGTTYNRIGGIRLDLTDDSEAGDTGSIVVTGEGEGLEFTPLTVDVRVGGPELLNRALSLPKDLQAGETFEPPLGVMNVGGVPSEGAVLRLYGSRGLSFPDDFGNCSSTVVDTGPLLRQHTEVLCAFPDTLEAGAAYALAGQVRVKTADFALHDIFSSSFRPLEPGEEKTLHEGRRQGSGPDLTLERTGDADPAQYTKYAELDLPTTNTYDLELTGASASGAAGDTVTAEIGFANNGRRGSARCAPAGSRSPSRWSRPRDRPSPRRPRSAGPPPSTAACRATAAGWRRRCSRTPGSPSRSSCASTRSWRAPGAGWRCPTGTTPSTPTRRTTSRGSC